MSRKRTIYSAEFKTKLVLEVLREDKTLAEITGSFLLKQNRIC
jgi:transposase-like protein